MASIASGYDLRSYFMDRGHVAFYRNIINCLNDLAVIIVKCVVRGKSLLKCNHFFLSLTMLKTMQSSKLSIRIEDETVNDGKAHDSKDKDEYSCGRACIGN